MAEYDHHIDKILGPDGIFFRLMPDRGLFTQTGDNMRGKFKLAKNQTQFQIKLPRPAQDSPDSLSKRGEDDAYTYMIVEPDGILIRPKKPSPPTHQNW